MTQLEYLSKKQRIMVSEAPVPLKEAAMLALEESYSTESATAKATAQIEECQPCLKDIGSHSD